MDLSDYRTYDALGLAELVARGAVSPHELLATAVSAVKAARPVNAVVSVMEPQARAAIDAGLPGGAFRGVPFALKDLWTQMAGQPTTNGSRLFADAVAAADSEIVARFRQAGLVLFAKTNTPELGLSPTTEPVLFGPTHNPWRPGVSPGGSSGGAAAAVAAGILPMAHATDGGGSIRIPASCCGVFGLKPSRGRVPFGPERGEGWGGMSAQHVVSRSVRDSAAALDAIAGPEPGDPYAAPAPVHPFLSAAGTDPRPLRIGLCTTAPGREEVHPGCREAAEATARRCADLGHHVVPVEWPFTAQTLARTRTSVVGPYVAAAVSARAAELGRPLAPGDLEPFTAALVERGRAQSATELVDGVQAMHEIGRAMGSQMEEVDLVLTPTLACLPVALGTLDGAHLASHVTEVRLCTAFVALANATGQPAMSVPLDEVDGLPVGSQFVARYGDEATLFALAGQLERAHPWFHRTPRVGGS